MPTTMPALRLNATDRWVTCTRNEDYMTSLARHIARKGGITTVCGATASSPEVWTPNTTKPRCDRCVEGYLREQEPRPAATTRSTR